MIDRARSNKATAAKIIAVFTMAISLIAVSCSPSGESTATSENTALSEQALSVADYAFAQYREEIINTLADLVSFKTVAVEGTANADNAEFKKMSAYLKNKAEELGLDFHDYGAVVVIGLGDSKDRFGIVTHGDVQPADPEKWVKSPFTLDRESEPDRAVGRGTEDDKGPIAMALYGMKALKDKEVPMNRRLELIISYTEETDWTPFTQFLQAHQPPDLNVALDAVFPVGTAEKGWCSVNVSFPKTLPNAGDAGPQLLSLTGGSFLSQVPEDATALIAKAGPDVEQILRNAAEADKGVKYEFVSDGDNLTITALGKSSHSSEPENGINAITHMAALLGNVEWARNSTALVIDFINDLVGTGYYAEKFGDIAYSHDFMGPLTLSLGTLGETENRQVIGINLRRPAGKDGQQLRNEINEALTAWINEKGAEGVETSIYIGDPHLIESAPHIPVLLSIFSHYTGAKDPQPESIGGGTHARLMPNGVNFGPHMSGRAYSGHSEHEFLLLKELDQDIKMYTAMMVEMATR